jgi:hypothetical protein
MTDFDDVLAELNDFGIYQQLRYLLICLAALLPPIGKKIVNFKVKIKFFQFNFNNKVTYIHSFTAANPNHRCSNHFDPKDSFTSNSTFLNGSISYEFNQCEYTANNESFKCDKWVFDKTYYKTTLTEDVNFCFLNHYSLFIIIKDYLKVVIGL